MPVLEAPISSAHRPLEPGSTGWTANDLDDPAVERQWLESHVEIISGVVATMAPAYFSGGESSLKLVFRLQSHLKGLGIRGGFAAEPDIVLSSDRVVRPDFAYLSAADKRLQKQAAEGKGKVDPLRSRLYVPPTLIIESLSPGHEKHDLVLKRRWYAEFGVPNYWLLNAFERSLECLVLDDASYRQDVCGKDSNILTPAAFPGLTVPLAEVWDDEEV